MTPTYTCPACDRRCRRLSSGVCLRCKAEFDRRNRAVVVAGRAERDHVRWKLGDKLALRPEDHAAFVGAEIDGVTEFEFTEDRGNPLDAELTGATENVHELAEALRAVLDWVWRENGAVRKPKSAMIRFVALSATLDPDLLDGMSYEKIGHKFGRVTKAAVSCAALAFQDKFAVQFSRSRRKEMR